MFDFVTYMEALATSSVDIAHTDDEKHFLRISSIAEMEEMMTNINHLSGYQLLAVDNLDGRFTETHADHIQDNPYYQFYLLYPVDRNDHDGIENAKKNCQAIVKKILSKINKDSKTDAKTPYLAGNGLEYLRLGSVTYYSVGPIGQNFYGQFVSFSILQKPNIVYNTDDWT